MNKIVSAIKQLSIFQKIQLLSAIMPQISIIFVLLTTYIVCLKNKLGYVLFAICSIPYFILMAIVTSSGMLPLLKYIICVLIALVGNYLMILVQRNKTHTF